MLCYILNVQRKIVINNKSCMRIVGYTFYALRKRTMEITVINN